MGHEKFIAGLRGLVEFYETHPEFPLPDLRVDVSVWLDPSATPEEQKEELARLARELGTAEKSGLGSLFKVSRDFGGDVFLEVLAERHKVCTPRVVGTREVPARPAEPAHTEPVIEWDCPPSILRGA